MSWMSYFFFMDNWLMPYYRWPEMPVIGFFLGTAILAAVAVLVGDLTFNLAVRADRKKINEVTGETVKMNNLSIEALQAGEGESYRACNKLANDSFGRLFFLQVALSTASLWPLPFALAWMQYRFMDVDFPIWGTGLIFSYSGVFLLLYILLRMGFSHIKPHLPFFRTSTLIFRSLMAEKGKMKSWSELMKVPEKKAVPAE